MGSLHTDTSSNNGGNNQINKQKRNKKYEQDLTQQWNDQLYLGKKTNNKKNQVSLNHLLHYESYRESDDYKNQRKSKNKRPQRTSFTDHQPDRYKVLRGMEFINLNYKFIVDYKGDYKLQQLDPNVPVPQNDIIRIIAPKGNACPICLSDEPIAPRMITACGHIICLKCMLSLLDTEIPTNKKRQASAPVVKYNDCPLCGAIIRKAETKPVLISNIDERFEIPKVGDDVILSLMTRAHSKAFAVPRAMESVFLELESFPFVDSKDPDLSSYSRIFKADLAYIIQMYQQEKGSIMRSYEEDKELYGDDGKYSMKAIEEINRDIDLWTSKYNDTTTTATSKQSTNDISSGNSFFFYETGFNAASTYVLSPLDIKVLKTNYDDDYSHLPSNVIAKVENIQYEELTPENSLKKYKYLSHLPLGTSIGFLQCSWYKNEYISEQTWANFKDELSKRSKKSTKKLEREERNRKRAENEEERKTRLFFQRENDPTNNTNFADYHSRYDTYEYDYEFEHPSNPLELPVLNSDNPETIDNEDTSSESVAEYETTVWGTKIKKSERSNSETVDEDDWNAAEMIRKAQEEFNNQEKGKKKKKKKIVLFSTSNH